MLDGTMKKMLAALIIAASMAACEGAPLTMGSAPDETPTVVVDTIVESPPTVVENTPVESSQPGGIDVCAVPHVYATDICGTFQVERGPLVRCSVNCAGTDEVPLTEPPCVAMAQHHYATDDMTWQDPEGALTGLVACVHTLDECATLCPIPVVVEPKVKTIPRCSEANVYAVEVCGVAHVGDEAYRCSVNCTDMGEAPLDEPACQTMGKHHYIRFAHNSTQGESTWEDPEDAVIGPMLCVRSLDECSVVCH